MDQTIINLYEVHPRRHEPARVSRLAGRACGFDGRCCRIVIHENRGLNPHIEDVARRLAVVSPSLPTFSR
jgi:hypothetical protein